MFRDTIEIADFIEPLGEATDRAVVGGKAANLAKLIGAGFPVPEGFVIAAGAPLIEEDILEAWRWLDAPEAAVRSSATAEDQADASMAGQYDSVLGISDTAG